MMPSDTKKIGAVYVSWQTFKNAIEQLAQAVPPNKIDRSVFPGTAWAIQNQLFTGMRFLGLIDDENRPTSEMEELAVPDESKRKVKLSQILHQRYRELFALDLKKTTPIEIQQKMADLYGVSGDTRDKAVRFFINAAEYVGIDMSPLFSAKRSNGSVSPRRARTRKPKQPLMPPQGSPTNDNLHSSGTSKVVMLKSGGTLTLSATLDLFALNPTDRKFVFDLIDRLDEYAQNSAKTETPDNAATLSGER